MLPLREQVPRETYRAGDRIVAFVVDIDKTARGPQIILSRTHKGLLEKLFEMEVPEIYEKIVRIEASAREPGARSKIAVSSRDRDVDPVGACVGMKGSRVQAVVQELRGEKIDIVPYDRGSGALRVQRDRAGRGAPGHHRRGRPPMELIVPDEKLSLAIGRKGQNVRLASQLTGWRIDIHSESKVREMEEQRQASHGGDRGLSEELARRCSSWAGGRRTEVARAKIEELAGVPGVGGEAGAARIKEAAAKQVEVEKKRAPGRRGSAPGARSAAEAKKSDEQRLLSVRGIDSDLAGKLQAAGFETVQKISAAESGGAGRGAGHGRRRGAAARSVARRCIWARWWSERSGATGASPDLCWLPSHGRARASGAPGRGRGRDGYGSTPAGGCRGAGLTCTSTRSVSSSWSAGRDCRDR